MKVLLILALIALTAMPMSISKNTDGNVEFVSDPNPNSPLSFMLKGILNPEDSTQNDVRAFFRLAEQLIPVAESLMGKENDEGLKLTRYWCYGSTGQAFSFCVYGWAELYIGWRINQVGETGGYNLTYVPYAYLRAGGNATVSSYPAEAAYGLYFSIAEVEAPFNFLVGSTQVCTGAKFNKFPTGLYTTINANLLQCQRSVPDMTPWVCTKIYGTGFRHLEYFFDAGLSYNLIPYTCINF